MRMAKIMSCGFISERFEGGRVLECAFDMISVFIAHLSSSNKFFFSYDLPGCNPATEAEYFCFLQAPDWFPGILLLFS